MTSSNEVVFGWLRTAAGGLQSSSSVSAAVTAALSSLDRAVSSGEIRDCDEEKLFDDEQLYHMLVSLLTSVLPSSTASLRLSSGVCSLPRPLIGGQALRAPRVPRAGVPNTGLTRITSVKRVGAAGAGAMSITAAPWGPRPNASNCATDANTTNIDKTENIAATGDNDSVATTTTTIRECASRVYRIVLGIMQVPEYRGDCAMHASDRADLVYVFAQCCRKLLACTHEHTQSPPPIVANVNAAQQQQDGSGATTTMATMTMATMTDADAMRDLIYHMYAKWVDARGEMLPVIAEYCEWCVRQRRYAAAVPMLEVVMAIVRGFKAPLSSSQCALLTDGLLCLFHPNDKVDDVTPVLAVYSEQLVYCVRGVLEKAPSLMRVAVRRIIAAFPPPTEPNSPKEVQLLHDLEAVLECATLDTFRECSGMFYPTLLRCSGSEYARLAQRALSVWRNDAFVTMALYDARDVEYVCTSLAPVLLGAPSWNSTVNKWRCNVLRVMESRDSEVFEACVARYWQQHGDDSDGGQTPPLERTHALMLRLEPPPSEEDAAAAAQRAPSHSIGVPASLGNVRYLDFVFGHVLGTGAISTVRYAKKIQRTVLPSLWVEYAVKVVDRRVIEAQSYHANIQREIAVMSRLTHPNITQLLGVCQSKESLYLVMEYAANGDLFGFVSRLGSLDEAVARFIMAEVVDALHYLHKNGVMYVDLKPENILVHHNWHVKLCDFGSAMCVDDGDVGEWRLDGTAEYTAPELVQGGRPSPASDMWALGCVLYQLLAGRTPLTSDESDMTRARDDVLAQTVHFDVDSLFPDTFPPHARDLVTRLMHRDPAARPSCDAVRAHPFFDGVDWARLHDAVAPAMTRGEHAPPVGNKSWARRKFSMMWAPMPKEYAAAGGGGEGAGICRYAVIED